MTEIKKKIQDTIQGFSDGNLSEQALYLFQTLGYNTVRQNSFSQKNHAFFKDSFLDGETHFNESKALVTSGVPAQL